MSGLLHLRVQRRLYRLYWAMALVTCFLVLRALQHGEFRLLCQFVPMLVLLVVSARHANESSSLSPASGVLSSRVTLIICVCIVLCTVDSQREKSWATGAEVAILLQDWQEVHDHEDENTKHSRARTLLLWSWFVWIVGGGILALGTFVHPIGLEAWLDQWTVTSVLVERFSHHALRENVANLSRPVRRFSSPV